MLFPFLKPARLLWLVSLMFPLFVFGQDDRVRTRTIDYTVYDQLAMGGISYARDKFSALRRLLADVESKFTPEDEEYFYAFYTAGTQYFLLLSYKESIDCFQKAINAYEKHFPFYQRYSYPMVTRETAIGAYTYLAQSFLRFNLPDKAVSCLEFRRGIFENSSSSMALHYYSVFAQALLESDQFGKAIDEALKLQAIVESGKPLLDMQPADSIYKILDTYPEETKAALLKAKEEYMKSMKSAEELTRSSQRMMYNNILSQAYFRQYKFKETIPYGQAWLREYANILSYSDEITAKGSEQLNLLADSVKQLINESHAYSKTVREIGGQAVVLIVPACKENQQPMALSFAKGSVDKAVYYQLVHNTEESERHYQLTFASIKRMKESKFYGDIIKSTYDFITPWYVNLQVQKKEFKRAYEENLKLITKEEDNLRKSFQFFSESEKREFFKAYNQKLDKFYSLLLLITEQQEDRAAEMLDKVLQTKGLVFDVTREQERRLKRISDKATLADIRSVRHLRDKLSAFYQASTTSPSAALMDSINRYSIHINELEHKINEKLGTSTDFLNPVSWRDVQRKLKQDEVYLEIVRVQRDNFDFDKPRIQYWAFAIRPGESKPLLIKLSERETFEDRDLRNYQNRIKILIDDNDSYNTYWATLEKALPGSRKIFLSSDGVYHMINPFTLKNPVTGNYLLQEIALTRVSTGRDLLAGAGAALTNTSVALVGNPAFDISRKELVDATIKEKVLTASYDRIEHATRSGFSALPGTQEELDLIGKLAVTHGFSAKALTGAKASEASVKRLKNPGVLHVATHGEFDQLSKVESFLKSKLVLAGAADDDPIPFADYGKYEDGFLTAYEVVQLELENTDLVMLSACETGLGEIQSGEGVWGLQRAFQVAGAKAVMGSLWKIRDEATVEFMRQFYMGYFKNKRVGDAYIQAMKTMAQKYPQPYFWGAFVVSQ